MFSHKNNTKQVLSDVFKGSQHAIIKTALCATAMMGALFVVFGITPFGDGTFLTGDLNGQYINYFAQMRGAIADGEGFFYSFYKALGGNMTGIIAYYAASPFVLLYMLFDPLHYGIVTSVVVFCKVLLMALSMAFFLTKRLGDDEKVVIPSLAYAFCGYVFVYMQNFMWHDVLMLLPLLCHGIDRLIAQKQPLPYIIALFLAVFTNFYIAFMACLFLVLYFLYSMIMLQDNTIKKMIAHGVRFATASLIGAALSGILLLPAIDNVFLSKEVGGSGGLQLTTEFNIAHFVARLLPFGFDWNNIMSDLPNVYAGIVTLMLTVAFFAAKGIPLKQKLASGGVLAVLFLSMFATDFMLLFHGFTAPVWFTHRHAFLFVFWACFLAATALTKAQFTVRTFVVTGATVAVALALRFLFKEPIYNNTRFLMTAALVAVLAVLFWLFAYVKKPVVKRLAVLAVLAVTMGELTLNTYYNHYQFEKYPNSTYKAFVTDGRALLSGIAAQDDDSYRVEKNYFRSLNDSFLLGYFGVSHFGSTQDTNNVNFVENLGLTGIIGGLYSASDTNIFSDSVAGIKYLLVDPEGDLPHGYEQTDIQQNGLRVYRNPYAFPLAFMLPPNSGYDTADFTSEQTFVQNLFNALNDGSITEPLFAPEGNINLNVLSALSQQTAQRGAQVELSRGAVTATITAEQDGMLFVSVPYSDELVITVNGQQTDGEILFSGQLGIPILQGENVISITYRTPLLAAGVAVSIAALVALVVWVVLQRRKVMVIPGNK